jgi:PST family polysaccharide transporter
LPLRDVGWFSAGMKVIDVVRVYPVLMMGVFFPVLSKLHTSDPPAFRQKQRRLLIFMAATLMLFAGLIYLGAPWIIQVLFKNDFAPASHLLRLLLPSLVAMGLNHIQMQLLIALNQERKLLVGAFIACASNVLLACFLLPRFGTSGACYALLGSETLYFIFLRQLTAANL